MPPSACKDVISTAPSPQAICRPVLVRPKICPGVPLPGTTRVAWTLKVLPCKVMVATGQGCRPRTWLCTCWADLFQSMGHMDLSSMGAKDTLAGSWAVAGSFPSRAKRPRVLLSSSAPSTAKRSSSSPAVSFSPMGVLDTSIMSPASISRHRYMAETPLSVRPSSTAH